MAGALNSEPDSNQVLTLSFDKAQSALQVKQVGSLIAVAWDTVIATYPTSVTEIYTFKTGATSVATVTVTYLDDTKSDIWTVVRS